MTEHTASAHGAHALPLPFDTTAPALARNHVRGLAAALPETVVEDAALLTSELVTNAVQHGRPDVWLEASVGTDSIEVAVHDDGDSAPPLTAVDADCAELDVHAASGRGLFLVATIAADWGVHAGTGNTGNTVWFRVRPTSVE